MTDACTLIEQCQAFSCSGGVSQEAISRAEDALGLRFSEDYRRYLMRFGAADYYGHELTGLGGPDWTDVEAITREARKANPDAPQSFYVIEETHIDGVVFWQSETGEVYESIPLTNPVKRFDCLARYVEGTRLEGV